MPARARAAAPGRKLRNKASVSSCALLHRCTAEFTYSQPRHTMEARSFHGRGAAMSLRKVPSAFAISALLCSTLSAWAQQDGAHPGKALVDAKCNTCHAI